MTNAPTTRETADHAELARLAEAATAGPWETYPETFSPRSFVIPTHHASDDPAVGSVLSRQDAAFIAAANPTTVLSLLSEIAALRGEVERVQRECDEMALHGFQAVQAERQRDEAVGLLRELADGRSQKNNINEYDDLSVRASTLLANQGAD